MSESEAATEGAEAAVEPAEPVKNTEGMSWYFVQTHSSYENRAKVGLLEQARLAGKEDDLGDVIIPMEAVVEVKKGERSARARKFFPGYMLVQLRLTDEMWHVIKDTPRIIGFVGGGTNPPPIPQHEVNRILGQMEEGMKAPTPVLSFQEGDQVRVIDGPFKNFSGVVEEVNPDKAKVRVLVSIFGRATPVELDFVQVEPAATE